MTLRVHLKKVEASCDTCLRSRFIVSKKEVENLRELCSKRVPPLDRDREVTLLRRRYNRLAQMVEILASSETNLNIIQPKIRVLRSIAESLGDSLKDPE